MKIEICISPCPNDTFMFHALLNGFIDTGDLELDVKFADIEKLNENIIAGSCAVSKFSYAVLPLIYDKYRVLASGSALGRGNGPLLVGRADLNKEDMQGLKVAVPGRYTTANLLMDRMFPEVTDTPEYLFSDIAGAVESGEADAGVLIHEGRFTYHNHGLKLIADLGLEWEVYCGMPLPLGGIAVLRDLPYEVQQELSVLLRQSIGFALENPSESYDWIKSYAQEMEDEVIEQHINLFVNRYSLNIGDEGIDAVKRLLGHHIPEKKWDTLFI
ncbi:MAG: 1,4-dihydroxy-6-naphthoate synthase [Rikenellaceae bacterium]|nr:1,4-dihydroxy-6-naphthoate synthase [Rikenellaceae bacterium]